MKSVILSIAICLSAFSLVAQDCKNFYYLIENSEVELTMYDKKGKVSGKNIYKIKDVKNDGGAYSSRLNYVTYDDKGKTIASGEGKFRCQGASIDIDMKMSVPSEQMTAYKDMEVKADDAFLSYPGSIEVGKTLPDGRFNMDILNNGSVFSSMNYDILNRKVESKETVTTPAGSWECYKISYDGAMTISTLGMKVPVNMKAYEWYAPGFGVIKTEAYSKNDKLMSSTLLTAIKK